MAEKRRRKRGINSEKRELGYSTVENFFSLLFFISCVVFISLFLLSLLNSAKFKIMSIRGSRLCKEKAVREDVFQITQCK